MSLCDLPSAVPSLEGSPATGFGVDGSATNSPMPPGALTRDELIALVARIIRAEEPEAVEDGLVLRFQESVVDPAASDLIFWEPSSRGAV
jgi:hypothetical protein